MLTSTMPGIVKPEELIGAGEEPIPKSEEAKTSGIDVPGGRPRSPFELASKSGVGSGCVRTRNTTRQTRAVMSHQMAGGNASWAWLVYASWACQWSKLGLAELCKLGLSEAQAGLGGACKLGLSVLAQLGDSVSKRGLATRGGKRGLRACGGASWARLGGWQERLAQRV